MKSLYLSILFVLYFNSYSQLKEVNDLILFRGDTKEKMLDHILKYGFIYLNEVQGTISYSYKNSKNGSITIVCKKPDGSILVTMNNKSEFINLENSMQIEKDNVFFEGESYTNIYNYLYSKVGFQYNEKHRIYYISIP